MKKEILYSEHDANKTVERAGGIKVRNTSACVKKIKRCGIARSCL